MRFVKNMNNGAFLRIRATVIEGDYESKYSVISGVSQEEIPMT